MALVIALVFVASIVCCHIVAKRHGSNPVFWGVMGAIFGPLAIPFVFMSKERDQK
jgi:hypothetical protein